MDDEDVTGFVDDRTREDAKRIWTTVDNVAYD